MTDRADGRMQKRLSLLFVCVGNTCRSAMAEGIARRRWPDYDVRSAGIGVHRIGQAAASEAATVMQAWGIDLDGHKATALDAVNIDGFEYIIAMDPAVMPVLRKKGVPDQKIREAFVDDPWSSDLGRYEECADEIGRRLENLKL